MAGLGVGGIHEQHVDWLTLDCRVLSHVIIPPHIPGVQDCLHAPKRSPFEEGRVPSSCHKSSQQVSVLSPLKRTPCGKFRKRFSKL